MIPEEREQFFLSAYDAYSDALFRYCFFKLSDRDRAKDAVQEIFMRLWTYLEKGNDIAQIKAFLFTTASNYIKDQWKKKSSLPFSSLESSEGEPFDVPIEDDRTVLDSEYNLALRFFRKLSDEDQKILQLRFVEDFSVKDIALTLSLRENTVAVKINRAIAKIQSYMKQDNG